MTKKNVITIKIEELQSSISGIIGRFDELKEILQKNLDEQVDKIKVIGQDTQEKGKKYIDSVMGLIPFKNYYDKIKDNDYTKLSLTIKKDLEGKFNVSIDQLLNTFNIASVLDIKDLEEKIKKAEKNLKKFEKAVNGDTASAMPNSFKSNVKKDADDLTKIVGVGKVYQQKLNDEGFFTFSQVANMNDEMIQVMEEKYSFKGDFKDAIKSAKKLAKK